jgi:hypothetical protein
MFKAFTRMVSACRARCFRAGTFASLFTGVVFMLDSQSALAQCQVQRLTYDGPPLFNHFGQSIGLSGNRAVISGFQVDSTEVRGTGYALVYRLDGAQWVHEATLSASDGTDRDYFAYAVGISGNHVFSWAPRAEAVYLFEREGTNWVETQKITPPKDASTTAFGSACALDGNVLIIGDDDSISLGLPYGAAYVYRFDGNDWNPEQRLIAGDPAYRGGSFGRSVAVHGDYILVADPFLRVGNEGSGFVYSFRFDGAQWIEEDIFTGGDTEVGDTFGTRIALHGDRAVVNAPYHDIGAFQFVGAAYVFRRDGTKWIQEAKLTPALRPNARIGTLALAQHRLLIGDVGRISAILGDLPGKVHVYERSGTSWVETDTLLPDLSVGGDFFGFPLAIDVDASLIGSRFWQEGATPPGMVFFFDLSGPCRSLEDYAFLQKCFGADLGAQPFCEAANLDRHGGVDLADYGQLLKTFTGP